MSTTVKNLPVASVTVEAGHNPRLDFDGDELKQLAASVKEHGVLQPILVTKAGQGYKLIAGERRLRAAKLAKLATIPAVIRPSVNGDGAALALIENVVRADLNPVEEAHGYQGLLAERKTAKQIAKVLSVPEQRIKDRLTILTLPEQAQGYIADGTVPLAAVPVLTMIAAASPKTAEAVSFLVATKQTSASSLIESPGNVIRDAARMLWHDGEGNAPEPTDCPACGGSGMADDEPDNDCGACDGTGEGPPPADRPEAVPLPITAVYETDLDAHRHMLTDAQFTALSTKLDEAIPPPTDPYEYGGHFRSLRFTADDRDAARAYGCLLELGNEFQMHAWVTDGEWLADRLGQIIDRAIDSHAKSERATKQHAPGQTGEKADRKKERDEAKKAQAKARRDNEKMGADLIAKRGSVKVTKDVALTLSYLILGGDRFQGINTAQSVAVSGLRYVHPDLARTREVRGKSSPDLAGPDEATAFLWEWIARAKTADEVIGRTLAAVLAGTFADEDAAPTKKAQTEKGSSYSLPTVTGGWSLTPADEKKLPGAKQLNDQLPALLDKLAKGVIPPALVKKARTRH